jgi:hypothetical protein
MTIHFRRAQELVEQLRTLGEASKFFAAKDDSIMASPLWATMS